MRKLAILMAGILAMANVAQAALTRVAVAAAGCDDTGNGTLEFPVDAKANPNDVEKYLRDNLELTNNAKATSFNVTNGVAKVPFTGGQRCGLVEANLPEERRGGAAWPWGAAAVAGAGVGICASGLCTGDDPPDEPPALSPVE
jgi:hypothetical protein